MENYPLAYIIRSLIKHVTNHGPMNQNAVLQTRAAARLIGSGVDYPSPKMTQLAYRPHIPGFNLRREYRHKLMLTFLLQHH